MKNIVKTFFISIFISYIAFSFMQWNLDISTWSNTWRIASFISFWLMWNGLTKKEERK